MKLLVNITVFRDCISLQDPHCAWDIKNEACVETNGFNETKSMLIQDIVSGDSKKCLTPHRGIYIDFIIYKLSILWRWLRISYNLIIKLFCKQLLFENFACISLNKICRL